MAMGLRARILPEAERAGVVARLWRPRPGGRRIVAAAPLTRAVVAALDTGEVQVTPLKSPRWPTKLGEPWVLPAELGPVAAVAGLPTGDHAVVIDTEGRAAPVEMGRACTPPAWLSGGPVHLGRVGPDSDARTLLAGPEFTVSLSLFGTLTALRDESMCVEAAQRVLGPVTSMCFLDPTRLLVLNAFGDLAMWDIAEDRLFHAPVGVLRKAMRRFGQRTLASVGGDPVIAFATPRTVGCTQGFTLFRSPSEHERVAFFSISPGGHAMAVSSHDQTRSILDIVDLATHAVVASVASYPGDFWARVDWPAQAPPQYCVATTRHGDAYVVDARTHPNQ